MQIDGLVHIFVAGSFLHMAATVIHLRHRKKMIFLADVGSVDSPVNDLVELGAAVYTGDGDLYI